MSDSTPPLSDDLQRALVPHRLEIDRIDKAIIDLLNERARVVVKVGQLKQKHGSPIYAPDREKAVLTRVLALNEGPLPDRSVEAVYREIMSGALALERPLRIGFLGPLGSFSHVAAARKFGSSVEYVPLSEIEAVFDAVVKEHVDYGLAPVENSLGGGVADTLDAFMGNHSAHICAEVLLKIHHNLLASDSWDKVKRIYSKPEAFAQCRKWLLSTARDRQLEAAPSTSRAAELAAADPTIGAIGSRLAGQLCGLNVLFENIEDNSDNLTRFFVLAKKDANPSGDDKTAVMFVTAHRPGSLAAVLDVFRDAGLNLTDIEKRPGKKVNWEYFFFVDLQGHISDPKVQKALADARPLCLQLRVLGSYPRALEAL